MVDRWLSECDSISTTYYGVRGAEEEDEALQLLVLQKEYEDLGL